MKTIFFDLETTDLNTVGQILNYAFVEIDESWNLRSCLRGTIKVSRLQLPNPYAICANRVDIIEHNKTADATEPVALSKIQKYISDIVEWDDVRLVGYNSNKFDVPYLRTSMIRNGLNPYFCGTIKYGDVIHVVRKLANENPEFYEKLIKKENGEPSFKLESVAKSFDLLSKEQDHESLSDVMLTIKVAQHLADNFGVDVRNYSSYEVDSKKQFDVVQVYPFRDQTGALVSDDHCNMCLLEENKTQALWINIKKFEEGAGRDAVYWYNKNTSSLTVKSYIKDDVLAQRAAKARQGLSDVTLANFFPPKNCDVEQFIFMMSISDIGPLYEAIWMKDLTNLKRSKSKYASQLYLRHLSNESDVDSMESQIKEYALYRYGGKLKLSKEHFDSKYEPGVYSEDFHPTYNELVEQIDLLAKDEKNAHLMKQLREFYDSSVISTLAGAELKSIKRTKNVEQTV